MPTADDVARKFENDSIYVILSLRGALPGFHWGIFIPSSTPFGNVWHATDVTGGWKLDPKATSGVPSSISLSLALKVGAVNATNRQKCFEILDSVPANGEPSPHTHEPFACRVWVKDALHALNTGGIIQLTQTIEKIEQDAIREAEKNRTRVEGAANSARIVNSYQY